MIRTEFIEQYQAIVDRALRCAEKARKESILGLTGEFDQEKADRRDIFDYGLRFVTDGVDIYWIEKILSNLVEQEKDEYKRILKKMQKEAVLLIQQGMGLEMVHSVLNSLTDIPLGNAEISQEQSAGLFDFVGRFDPAEMLDVLTREQPLTIAIVLSHLEPPKASVLLQYLPPGLQGEVARLIATMDRISIEIIQGIARSIEKKISSYDHCGDAGGVECMLEILELMDQEAAKQIITAVNEDDPELADELKNRIRYE